MEGQFWEVVEEEWPGERRAWKQAAQQLEKYCSGKDSPKGLLMTMCWVPQMLMGPKQQGLEGKQKAGSNLEQLGLC